jgi:hypothetical protein
MKSISGMFTAIDLPAFVILRGAGDGDLVVGAARHAVRRAASDLRGHGRSLHAVLDLALHGDREIAVFRAR